MPVEEEKPPVEDAEEEPASEASAAERDGTFTKTPLSLKALPPLCSATKAPRASDVSAVERRGVFSKLPADGGCTGTRPWPSASACGRAGVFSKMPWSLGR